jgi:hypothetical protein
MQYRPKSLLPLLLTICSLNISPNLGILKSEAVSPLSSSSVSSSLSTQTVVELQSSRAGDRLIPCSFYTGSPPPPCRLSWRCYYFWRWPPCHSANRLRNNRLLISTMFSIRSVYTGSSIHNFALYLPSKYRVFFTPQLCLLRGLQAIYLIILASQ